MCGNIHSATGYVRYNKNVLVRVGIGGGSVCKTRYATGFTRGQITEIKECSDYKRNISEAPFIVADGGIKYSGDIIKAFGAGADYVMIGGLLKNAQEAQNVIDGDFSYWGGASKKQQKITYGHAKRHSEGAEVVVKQNEIIPLKDIFEEIWGGVESGISYSGYETIKEFIGKGHFEIIK
jgi:IMP dehydrogenase/GMP reductase